MAYDFFVSSPPYIEDLLAAELKSFGADRVKIAKGGVSFSGSAAIAYRTCLWTRTGNRVILQLASFQASEPEQVYNAGLGIEWDSHFSVDQSFKIETVVTGKPRFVYKFAALKLKDAVCDYFRKKRGARPDVDREVPDAVIFLFIDRDRISIGLDLAGESLHRRRYRLGQGEAPLKENIAAAVLLRADWPASAAQGKSFCDPMCGSGTLLIEAAMIAGDIAPGLGKNDFGFLKWKMHDRKAWQKLLEEAQDRKKKGMEKLRPVFYGFDIDLRSVREALKNAEKAGLGSFISIEKKRIADLKRTHIKSGETGLIAVNPPYGKRISDPESADDTEHIYRELGVVLKNEFSGWRAMVLAGDDDQARSIGLRATKINRINNGRIPCVLACFDITGDNRLADPDRKKTDVKVSAAPAETAEPALSEEMLFNRLKKNLKNVLPWAKREQVTCFRVYDADRPEYNVAVDFYEGKWVHIQEYEAPPEIDEEKVKHRLSVVLATVKNATGAEQADIFLKKRSRQKGKHQYERMASASVFQTVSEFDCRFAVNFTDYLDTGIFLDQREIRKLLRQLSAGRSFLNLFGYTGTAAVCAAKGGAADTTTVDGSATYSKWAERNYELNRLSLKKNRVVCDDVHRFLSDDRKKYGLVYLDMPTFSNSKSGKKTFSVQNDHVDFIRLAAERLEKDGILIFANNFRKFRLHSDELGSLSVADISASTIPFDFKRNMKIHHCFRISR